MTALQAYYLLHVLSVIALITSTFTAFAAPDPERRKKALMTSGILSLLALTGGMGLLARTNAGWPLWVIVKLVCWLVISSLAGIAFRKRESIGALRLVAMLAVATAVSFLASSPDPEPSSTPM